MTDFPIVWIIGGGTVSHVRPHLALAAPAYGGTAQTLTDLASKMWRPATEFFTVFTRMAGGAMRSRLPHTFEALRVETNEDVAKLLDRVVAEPRSKVLFMSAALCDFDGQIWKGGDREYQYGPPRFPTKSGKDQPRLKTEDGQQTMVLTPAEKIISRVRRERKDIFLVGFKTTAGATPDEQYMAGLKLLKTASCNLVLANDIHTRLNMVITPEQARYHETTDRTEALRGLVEMTALRSQGKFTRSTVVPGDAVPWASDMVPASLRAVVDHCIKRGAYKPFLGSTVGHFAVKVGDGKFLTSRRKTDFNKLDQVGLVMVEAKGMDEVVAYGFRPSVGGQSQRIVFEEHPGLDCIVHFHCPLKPGAIVPVREQRPHECGSHQCGKNTSDGLVGFYTKPGGKGIYAVMLDKHGPNVVFNRDADPEEVIRFIEENFDLEGRTDNVAPTVAAKYREAPSKPLPIGV